MATDEQEYFSPRSLADYELLIEQGEIDLPPAVVKSPLLQRDIESFAKAQEKLRGKAFTHRHLETIACGISAGWYESPATEHHEATRATINGHSEEIPQRFIIDGRDILDLEPWRARYYAMVIEFALERAYFVPKNS